jgi:hypothetical protein
MSHSIDDTSVLFWDPFNGWDESLEAGGEMDVRHGDEELSWIGFCDDMFGGVPSRSLHK